MTPAAFIKNLAKNINDYLASLPVEPEQSCAGDASAESHASTTAYCINCGKTFLSTGIPTVGASEIVFHRNHQNGVRLGKSNRSLCNRCYVAAYDALASIRAEGAIAKDESKHPLPALAEGEASEWANRIAAKMHLESYGFMGLKGKDAAFVYTQKDIALALDAARQQGRAEEREKIAGDGAEATRISSPKEASDRDAKTIVDHVASALSSALSADRGREISPHEILLLTDLVNYASPFPSTRVMDAQRNAIRKLLAINSEFTAIRAASSGDIGANFEAAFGVMGYPLDKIGGEYRDEETRNCWKGFKVAINAELAAASRGTVTEEEARESFEAEWGRHEDGHHSVICKNLARQFYFAAIFGKGAR